MESLVERELRKIIEETPGLESILLLDQKGVPVSAIGIQEDVEDLVEALTAWSQAYDTSIQAAEIKSSRGVYYMIRLRNNYSIFVKAMAVVNPVNLRIEIRRRSKAVLRAIEEGMRREEEKGRISIDDLRKFLSFLRKF